MALIKVRRIQYCEGQREDQKIEFVHEILRTKAEATFRRPHTQDFYELIFFIGGTREVRVGETIYTCGPGDILCLTPEEEHVSRPHDCLLDRYTIHLGRAAFDVFGDAARPLLALFTARKLYTGNYLRLPPKSAMRVNGFLADTDRLLTMDDSPVSSLEAVGTIMRVLSELYRCVHIPEVLSEPNRLLLDIVAYMETNYATIENIEEICREFGISRSGMWRLFTSHKWEPPAEYLRSLRLIRARWALEQGYSVTEASIGCGFDDTSHFIRLFREQYGVTPYRYRSEYRERMEKGGRT